MSMKLCFLAALQLCFLVHAYEVPMERVDPPYRDPKPEEPKITHKAYIKVHVDNASGSSAKEFNEVIVLGLYGEIAPKLVYNFMSLIRCDKGNGALSGKPLCYKGSTFHRIIPDFMMQGGDFTHHDGTGGETVYDGKLIEDESFEVQHNRPYLLSMANKGRPNSNGSQFFITTVKTQWLDGKHVVFGRVLEGQEIIKNIEQLGSDNGKPRAKVTIVDSGEMLQENSPVIAS